MTTSEKLICAIDEDRFRETGGQIAWEQLLSPSMKVDARSQSRIPHVAGSVDIGARQNWLYSKSLHSDPIALRDRIIAMIKTALNS